MRTVGPVVPATIEGRKVILRRRLPGVWGTASSGAAPPAWAGRSTRVAP